jgi:hypothetical protein
MNLVWTELNYNCFWFCNLIKKAADLFLIFVIFGCGSNFGSVTVYVLSTDVLQPLTCLEAGTFVDDVQQKGSVNIYNVNNNIIIEINVVF